MFDLDYLMSRLLYTVKVRDQGSYKRRNPSPGHAHSSMRRIIYVRDLDPGSNGPGRTFRDTGTCLLE